MESVGEDLWDMYQAVASGKAIDTGILYDALVRQPHLVMFGALSLVVALSGSGLVESAPV
jgi:hypothetical protein